MRAPRPHVFGSADWLWHHGAGRGPRPRMLCAGTINRATRDIKPVYRGGHREVHLPQLLDETSTIPEELEEELVQAEKDEDFERARRLKELQQRTESLQERLYDISDDDSTDARYQCGNEKQRLAAEVSRATADKHLRQAHDAYSRLMMDTESLVDEHGSDEDRQRLEELKGNQVAIESTSSIARIESEMSRMSTLYWNIQMRRPEVLQGLFLHLSDRVSSMNQPAQAESLIRQGQVAAENSDWATLREVNSALFMLLPSRQQGEMRTKIGFF